MSGKRNENGSATVAEVTGVTDVKNVANSSSGNEVFMRYSDDELEEFRQIVVSKLDKARKDFEILKSSINHEGSNGTDDTAPTFHILNEGATTLSKEEAGRLAQRQEKFIQCLQAALVRIGNKTYGICRETGKLIAKERLRAVPHATLSIDAKIDQDKIKKKNGISNFHQLPRQSNH